MTRPQTYALIGGLLLAGGVTYGMAKRGRNKKLIQAIYDVLDTTGGSGTTADMAYFGAFDPNYWIDKPGQMSESDATRLASQIHDAWGFWDDDEDAVYGALNAAKNWVQISQVTYAYNQEYGKDLFAKLDDSLNGSEMMKVQEIIERKPKM